LIEFQIPRIRRSFLDATKAHNVHIHFTFKGDPTEECVRCNKVYLAATAELKQGLCSKCLDNPAPSDDQENEDIPTISHRHKKFNNKLMNKLNSNEMTTSGTEEEDEEEMEEEDLSNASSPSEHRRHRHQVVMELQA